MRSFAIITNRLVRYAARNENLFPSLDRITDSARTARLRGSGAGPEGPRKRPSRGPGQSPGLVDMARPATVSAECILAAAAAEFAARGYAGARVDRIARRARVNKAMLYYHFRSKQAIYRELLRATFRDAADRLQAVAASDVPPTVALDHAIQAIADLAQERAYFPSVMLREIAEGGAHLDRETLAALSAVPKAFGDLIARGVRAGAFQPVHPVAAYVTMIAPIVFFLASAPIRQELAHAHLLNAALPPAAFIAHVQQTMRHLLAQTAAPAAAPRLERR